MSPLPDVADQTHSHAGAVLDWVGMDGIEMPLHFDAGNGDVQRVSGRIGLFVDLAQPDRRGIHMSRLYLLADEYLATRPLDAPLLESMLRAFLASQRGLAQRARASLRFDLLVRRTALRSDHAGWRAYPVSIDAYLDSDGFRLELGAEVTYSSTCPASAALSRQLIQQQFARDFDTAKPLEHASVLAWLGSERGIVATPHAQRSVARLAVRFAGGMPLDLVTLIDRVEQALGTPVQAAVKREDEQAFAHINGANPMFCEDAARRIQPVLDGNNSIVDFHVCVEHQESLHPHDAVAHASKSIPWKPRQDRCSATELTGCIRAGSRPSR